MRAKSLALLVLALGCGLVASIGITQVMSNKEDPVAPAEDEQTVFVTKEDPLTADVLRLENWPVDKVPEGALTRIEDIEGRLTKMPLVAGLPVVESNLFAKGEGPRSSWPFPRDIGRCRFVLMSLRAART